MKKRYLSTGNEACAEGAEDVMSEANEDITYGAIANISYKSEFGSKRPCFDDSDKKRE